MGKKKKQTVGYKYYAYGHFVLCHGPIDAITRIRFQDKDAYTNVESANKRIYINKPNLFGGDEQSGGIQGKVDLLFGYPDQPKSSVIAYITDTSTSALTATNKFDAISSMFPNIMNNASTALISAWRGITSVVFNNVYIGTSPTMPDSKWRVKRIHTVQDGETQWYDEKAEINLNYYSGSIDSYYKYHVQDGFTALSQLAPYAAVDFNDALWLSGQGPFGYASGSDLPAPNTYVAPGAGKAIMIRQAFNIENTDSIGNLKISMRHDDGGVLYWNGEQITLTTDSYFISRATIPNSKIKTGKNVLFCAAVDSVPTGTPNGIYLYLEYSSDSYAAVESDINPAHIIRECLTNSLWGKGADSSVIDDDSFTAAADTLYEEGMGISIVWSASSTIKEFISNILDHINGELYVDRTTNLWTLKLIREDYDSDTLEVITESQYKSLEFERKTLAECVNQVTVTYYDRERAKDSTVAVQDIGRIAQQGGTIAQEVDYKGFTNSSLASRVALRDLKTLSSELATISFDTTEDVAIAWNPGHVFKFSSTKYGLDEAIFRITEIKFGDGVDNTVSIKAIEDSFSSPMQSVVEYMPPVKSDISAKDATAITFEVPYIELVEQYGQDEIDAKLEKNPDLSFVGMAAIRPNNQHINASLYSNAGAGYAEEATLDFCPNATLVADIGYLDTSFEIKNVAEFDNLAAGNRMQIDDELVTFVSYDDSTSILTVKRGTYDTQVKTHSASAIIYGWDNYSGIDTTEYASGESVSMKALTLTGSDILDISDATAHSVTCTARAFSPYGPANVKINGEYFPESANGDLTLTWSHRNRLQQTGGTPVAWTDSSVTIDSGVEYIVELYDGDDVLISSTNVGSVSTYTLDTSGVNTANGTVKIYTVRDGFKSFMAFEHTMILSFAAPYNVVGTYNATTTAVDLTWDFYE